MRGTLVLSFVLALGGAVRAAQIDYAGKVITSKIVYYGAATAALHENLLYIYNQTDPDKALKQSVLERRKERSQFFDYLQMELGEIRGFKTKFNLYTVPTRTDANKSRITILRGADAIVFVVDSDPAQLNANIAAWQELKRNLQATGYAPGAMPIIVQLDRRELENAVPIEKLKQALGLTTEPAIPAIVPTGIGVFESLKSAAKLVLTGLKKQD